MGKSTLSQLGAIQRHQNFSIHPALLSSPD
jgi:hypothetical protein